MKNKSLPLVFRNILYNLRGGFLVRPLAIALMLGLAGAMLSWIEELFPAFSAVVPKMLFPSHEDPQVAQVILAGIAASIMTVVSIVFAILLMTLTLASMQFSPRIIVSFAKDRVTQRTLGIFLGTFCYCMAALPAAHAMPTPFEPVVTVCGAMLLAIACVGWLLFFIHHISHAISVNFIVDRIAAETEVMINDTMPTPRRLDRPERHDPAESIVWDSVILSDQSGYIRFVDAGRILALAKTYRVKIKVIRRVGHFVPAGIPFLKVSGGDRLPSGADAEFRSAFDFGPSRTLQQDVEFGVLQIVDIALKAISPAVNDPSTAINCIDQLSRILIRFAAREDPESSFYDLPGVLRLSISWISFAGLLDSAFEQIRHYATGDLAVCLRLMRALGDIASATADPEFQRLLAERGKRIIEGSSKKFSAEEVALLRGRMVLVSHDA